MTQEEFLIIMREDVLETDMEIFPETLLKDINEWDSLAYVNFVAMVNTTCGTTLDRVKVQTAKTINDLFNLLKS